MTMAMDWLTLDEAESKYGVEKTQIAAWVEEGVVRAETAGDEIVRINADDLELKMREWLP